MTIEITFATFVFVAIFLLHLSEWTHRGRVVAPEPCGSPGRRDEETAGPHPGRRAPPPAPHGGRRLAGSPGGPVGARSGEQKEEREQVRKERREGGTA